MTFFEITVLIFLLIAIICLGMMLDHLKALRNQIAELSQRIAPYDLPEEIYQRSKDFNINDIGRTLEHIQSDLNNIEMHISSKKEHRNE